jgi:hypothetical protein
LATDNSTFCHARRLQVLHEARDDEVREGDALDRELVVPDSATFVSQQFSGTARATSSMSLTRK